MDRNEKERIIKEVVEWCREKNILIVENKSELQKRLFFPELSTNNGSYRVGDRTWEDDNLACSIVYNGYSAEEIERAICQCEGVE